MRNLGLMLMAIGIFACYGTYKLTDNQSFRYRNTQTVVTAQEDPEGYRGTLNVTMSLAVIGMVGGIFFLIRSRKK